MDGGNVREPALGEVLAALSHALDITEGQVRGHSMRSGAIAVALGRELDLSERSIANLYYAALLKDSGCSNNAARIHKIFGGDELLNKQKVKLVDWSNPVVSVKFALGNLAPGGTVAQKLVKMVGLIGPPSKVMDEVTMARCTRGAAIALQLGFDDEVAEAVHSLDEHWDGKGSPSHLRGKDIPLGARILGLAQTLEVFVTTYGLDAGFEMIRARTGRWFDPDVAAAAMSLEHCTELWADHQRHVMSGDLSVAPEFGVAPIRASLDQICQAFASIVDAKSTFTGEHSTRVTRYSVEIAEHFGFRPERVSTLRRAALLHDVGKLGVPNSILDKPGKLNDEEYDRIKLHPKYSYEILRPIRGFERVTELAANHHERLDGRGYWRGLSANDLDLDMRIIAVADVFDALSAERPYRRALRLNEVFDILERDSGHALDGDCICALGQIYQGQEYAPAARAA